jgi:aryl-alcohol dehydrogenase-like predicted oxidoreductase
MNYSFLGASDLKISQIGLGCMSLPADETQALPLLHRAMDLGINFFDTADIYQHGKNEDLVGKAIKDRRNKIILASKVGNVNRADGNGLDWNPSKEHILSGIEESLKRLNTDYIDLYQLHGGTIQDNIDETIEAFELLKQQGKIRHYGISSIRPNVIREYIKRSSIVSVMMQYSLLDRRPEEECLDLIHKNRTGVLSRGSVAQGLLIGKPPKPYLDRDEQQVKKAADAVKTISGNKRTPTQTAIRYVLQHAAVSSAVVGTRTMQQLEDVAATITSPELTNEEIIFLKNSIAANKYKDHR